MKKSKLLIALIIVISAFYGNLYAQQSIYVEETNGTLTEIPLTQVQKIIFSGTNMVLHKTDATSLTWATSDVQKYFYDNINCNNTGTDIQTACETFNWIDGNTYTESNNTATYTLTNAAGCDSVVTLNLTIINTDNTISQDEATLTANATGLTYQWLDCDNNNSPIEGATGQSFTATVNGNYAVEITNGTCVKISNCYSVISLGINNLSNCGISIMPNPVSDVLQIKGDKQIQTISLIDNSGRIINTYSVNGTDYKINLSAMKAGVYFINIDSDSGLITKKIIILK